MWLAVYTPKKQHHAHDDTHAVTLQSVLMVPLWLQVADHLPRCHKDPASLQLASGCLLQSCELELQQEGVVVHTNRRLHNAALGSVTFSHLPPIKLSCIRGLAAASYKGPCLHFACKCLVARTT